MPSPGRSALRGVRDAVTVFLPAIPFGLIVGLTVAETSVPNLTGWLTSSLIFAGAAQLAAVSLLGAGAAWGAALAAALVVNARHLMYSAAMVPRFRAQPRWFRWVGPYVLIDQIFALTSAQPADDDVGWRSYYLGVGGLFWASWQVTVGVGVLAGPIFPPDLEFEFAVPAMFVGLVVPALTKRPAVLAAVAGAVTTALLWQIPNRGGMLVGGAVGALVGYLAEGDDA